VRAETGCLYAVSDDDFRKKYRIEDDQDPPASGLFVHTCWPAAPTPTPPEGIRLWWLAHTPQYRH
jgi:hypothetical protein